jgi:glycosyltransferase involved in cell wall biosynthesis
MQAPLVTIVTPSFNQGQFIRATIESVLTQDYPHIEYIIMDGGSTDATAEVVREYAGRLTWISERDRGQSDAINKGFRMAKGQIVSWLNSDDVLLPGAVSRAVQAFEQDPCLGFVYGEGYQMDEAGRFTQKFPWTEPFNLWKLTYVLDYILQQTVFFRKDVLDELGYLDESLHWTMDWDIFVRIGSRYPVGYIPELMAAIREYETAKSFAGGRRRLDEIARTVRRQTGQRFPPAFFFYALSTYEKLWRDRMQAAPRLLAAPCRALQVLFTYVCTTRIERVYRDSQGWYRDGWAGPRMHHMMPAAAHAKIAIQGSLPDLGRRFRKQSIRVFAEDREIGSFQFGPGNFHFVAELPAECEGAVRLRLEAARHFVPGGSGAARDGRKLSYKLQAIGLEGAVNCRPKRAGV